MLVLFVTILAVFPFGMRRSGFFQNVAVARDAGEAGLLTWLSAGKSEMLTVSEASGRSLTGKHHSQRQKEEQERGQCAPCGRCVLCRSRLTPHWNVAPMRFFPER